MPRHSTQTLAEPHYHGHYELGILAQDVRRYRMAIARYRREIALTNFYKAHYNLGTILQERKRYAEALKEYKEAVRKCPRFVAAHNNMGIIYTGLKQYHRAIQAFSRAILIDKTNALFFFNGLINFRNQIIDLPFRRTNFNCRINNSGRPNQLFYNIIMSKFYFIFSRSSR